MTDHATNCAFIQTFRGNRKEKQRNLNKKFLKSIDDVEIESEDGGKYNYGGINHVSGLLRSAESIHQSTHT